jgi:hypothetical protein
MRNVKRKTDAAWGQKSGLISKEESEKADLAIAKWMIDASIPFDAVNSINFQHMVDVIRSRVQGIKFQTCTVFVVLC